MAAKVASLMEFSEFQNRQVTDTGESTVSDKSGFPAYSRQYIRHCPVLVSTKTQAAEDGKDSGCRRRQRLRLPKTAKTQAAEDGKDSGCRRRQRLRLPKTTEKTTKNKISSKRQE
ncbi:uncharacterized [Tachysurus ichikawai]